MQVIQVDVIHSESRQALVGGFLDIGWIPGDARAIVDNAKLGRNEDFAALASALAPVSIQLAPCIGVGDDA